VQNSRAISSGTNTYYMLWVLACPAREILYVSSPGQSREPSRVLHRKL